MLKIVTKINTPLNILKPNPDEQNACNIFILVYASNIYVRVAFVRVPHKRNETTKSNNNVICARTKSAALCSNMS